MREAAFEQWLLFCYQRQYDATLRIAVEREKEFGGHLREWPDLRAQDDHIIQMKKQGLCPQKE